MIGIGIAADDGRGATELSALTPGLPGGIYLIATSRGGNRPEETGGGFDR